MINFSGISRGERYLSRKETNFTLSTLFYQFYANLELSERIKGLSKFESTSCLFAFSFISITLLYYYFLNSVYLSSNKKLKGRASTKVSFRIVITAILTQLSLKNIIYLNLGEGRH